MTKKELIKLVSRCGVVLHRGSTDDLKSKRKADFNEIAMWRNKIVALLDCHTLELKGGRHRIFCALINRKDNNRAHVALVEDISQSG